MIRKRPTTPERLLRVMFASDVRRILSFAACPDTSGGRTLSELGRRAESIEDGNAISQGVKHRVGDGARRFGRNAHIRHHLISSAAELARQSGSGRST